MRRFVFAATLALAATPAAAEETGFNPGTVVGNVYESRACAAVCGFGYSPPAYADARFAPTHRQHHKRAIAVHD